VEENFEDFIRRREAASDRYIAGDATALQEMLTGVDPATFMPPSGVVVEGAVPVQQAQVSGAAAFGPKSTGHFEVLNSGSSGDLAFWAGRQVATMDVKGRTTRSRWCCGPPRSSAARAGNGSWSIATRTPRRPRADRSQVVSGWTLWGWRRFGRLRRRTWRQVPQGAPVGAA